MVTPAGLLKILDFGCARRAPTQETRTTLTSSLATCGTLAYMAPEVLMGGQPDRRSDIFSMGVVFYEALAQQHPFRGDPAKAAGRSLRAGLGPIPGVVPDGVDPVIARMLARDPAQRYQTCADVLADIRKIGRAHV